MRRLAALAAAAALAGCTLEPHYMRPEPPVPPSWPVGDAYLRQSEAALPSVRYQDIFRDGRLQTLIAQALVNNRDLRIAAANIAEARARYRIQRAEIFPTIGASAGVRINRSNNGSGTVITTPGSGNGGTTGGGASGAGNNGGTDGGTIVTGGGASTNTSYSVDLGITAFEIDLFGRLRSLTRAALDQYFATEAAARATRLTLIGDIATAWFTYASDQSLLKIAEQTAANAQRSVQLTRARLEGGIAPRTDLRQAEQILYQAQSDLAESRTAVAQDVNALQLLVGAPIDPVLLPASIEAVANSVDELPVGLVSTVLLRRPDVVQAEYQLRAANAQIGAARADLFPRISLTALAGLASTSLGGLFSGDAFNWSVSPNVSYSIFDFGAARAGVAVSRAQQQAALATWERTVQTAFREVSDALARRGTIGEQTRADRAQVDATADTYRLAEARYRGGIDTFLATLDAQRSLYAAQRNLVSTELVSATNLVTLYRVIGGDSLIEATAQGPVPLSSGTP